MKQILITDQWTILPAVVLEKRNLDKSWKPHPSDHVPCAVTSYEYHFQWGRLRSAIMCPQQCISSCWSPIQQHTLLEVSLQHQLDTIYIYTHFCSYSTNLHQLLSVKSSNLEFPPISICKSVCTFCVFMWFLWLLDCSRDFHQPMLHSNLQRLLLGP